MNKQVVKKIINLYVFFVLLVSNAYGFQSPYDANGEINQQQLETALSKLEFDKTKNSVVLKEKFVRDLEKEIDRDVPVSSGLGQLLEPLAYLVLFVLIGFLIVLLVKQIKIAKKIPTLADDDVVVEDIEEIDADAEYKSALAAGNYRLAIRMQFIRTLQILQEQKKVDWQVNKTNRDYTYELEERADKKIFKELATTFEWVWYGNTEISRRDFDLLNPSFEQFNHSTNEQ